MTVDLCGHFRCFSSPYHGHPFEFDCLAKPIVGRVSAETKDGHPVRLLREGRGMAGHTGAALGVDRRPSLEATPGLAGCAEEDRSSSTVWTRLQRGTIHPACTP